MRYFCYLASAYTLGFVGYTLHHLNYQPTWVQAAMLLAFIYVAAFQYYTGRYAC